MIMGQYGGEEGWFLAFITCLFLKTCVILRSLYTLEKCRRTRPTPNPETPAAAGNQATGPPSQGPSHQIDHKLEHQLAQLELVCKEYKQSVGSAGFMNTCTCTSNT